MEDSENPDRIPDDVVCDPIVPGQHLARVPVVEFGDEPTQAGKSGEALDCLDNVQHERVGVELGIPRDVGADALQILLSGPGPNDAAHTFSLRRASSWVTTCPSSAACRPFAIFMRT